MKTQYKLMKLWFVIVVLGLLGFVTIISPDTQAQNLYNDSSTTSSTTLYNIVDTGQADCYIVDHDRALAAIDSVFSITEITNDDGDMRE